MKILLLIAIIVSSMAVGAVGGVLYGRTMSTGTPWVLWYYTRSMRHRPMKATASEAECKAQLKAVVDELAAKHGTKFEMAPDGKTPRKGMKIEMAPDGKSLWGTVKEPGSEELFFSHECWPTGVEPR